MEVGSAGGSAIMPKRHYFDVSGHHWETAGDRHGDARDPLFLGGMRDTEFHQSRRARERDPASVDKGDPEDRGGAWRLGPQTRAKTHASHRSRPTHPPSTRGSPDAFRSRPASRPGASDSPQRADKDMSAL